MPHTAEYELLRDKLNAKGVDVERVKATLKTQRIETPSWGYGNGGTRFKVFEAAGAARTIWEKVEDAAYIHAQGTNIAHIVAFLLHEKRLGGFHLNARRYADADLIVGSNNPFELFEIYCELAAAGEQAKDVAYMIDQSHNIEPKQKSAVQPFHPEVPFSRNAAYFQRCLEHRQ